MELKYEGEFYHADYVTVDDFRDRNKTELEDRLYEIAKSEIESNFFERVYANNMVEY